MEEMIYYSELYDLYGELLTEKQKNYFEDYYFSNLSFSEMSENYQISRNAVHKQVKEACEKLVYYDSVLKLKEKKEKIEKISNKIREERIKEELLKIF